MTPHDKALEAAAKVLIDNGIDMKLPWGFEAFQRAIIAYHAALEGQEESEIAEIRKRHDKRSETLADHGFDDADAYYLLRKVKLMHGDEATLLTRLAAKAAEAERLRAELAERNAARQELVSLFCNEELSLGNEGDLAGWQTEHTAVVAIRRGRSALAKCREETVAECSQIAEDRRPGHGDTDFARGEEAAATDIMMRLRALASTGEMKDESAASVSEHGTNALSSARNRLGSESTGVPSMGNHTKETPP